MTAPPNSLSILQIFSKIFFLFVKDTNLFNWNMHAHCCLFKTILFDLFIFLLKRKYKQKFLISICLDLNHFVLSSLLLLFFQNKFLNWNQKTVFMLANFLCVCVCECNTNCYTMRKHEKHLCLSWSVNKVVAVSKSLVSNDQRMK